MAQYVDDIRGNGLVHVRQALGDWGGHQPKDHQIFGGNQYDSPPLEHSSPSGTLTQSASPVAPDEERRVRGEWLFRLELESRASYPYSQFKVQYAAERERVCNKDPKVRGIRDIPADSPHAKEAYENVKNSWKEQGIWKSEWDDEYRPGGHWKHEEPLEVESETEEEPTSVFGAVPRRRPKSDEEKRQIAERREREREASRPLHQFLYQVLKRREQIENEAKGKEGNKPTADIEKEAREYVKSSWVRQCIWNKRWTDMPGMSWKHEEPVEEDPEIDLVSMQKALEQPFPTYIGGGFGEVDPKNWCQPSIVNGPRQEVRGGVFSNGHVQRFFYTSSSSSLHSMDPSISSDHSMKISTSSGHAEPLCASSPIRFGDHVPVGPPSTMNASNPTRVGDHVPTGPILVPTEQNLRKSPSTMNASISSDHSMKISKSSNTSLSEEPQISNDGAHPPSIVVGRESQTFMSYECQRRRTKGRQESTKEPTATGSSASSFKQSAAAKKLARVFRKVWHKVKAE